MVSGVVLLFRIQYCFHLSLGHMFQNPLIVDFKSSVASPRSRAFRKSITTAEDDILHDDALGGIRSHEADLYQAQGYIPIRHSGRS